MGEGLKLPAAMKSNETPVAFSREQIPDGYRTVLVYELIENPYYLHQDPTQPLIGDIDTKVLNSRWLITRWKTAFTVVTTLLSSLVVLNRVLNTAFRVVTKVLSSVVVWKTAFRVVTLLSSLVAIGFPIFGKQEVATIVFRRNREIDIRSARISCEHSGSVMFLMYINVAFSAYVFLQLIVSTLLMRKNAVAEEIPTSIRWSAFVLHVVAFELLQLAFVASWIIDVLNSKFGTQIFTGDRESALDQYFECSYPRRFPDAPVPYANSRHWVDSDCLDHGKFKSCSIQWPEFSLTIGVIVLTCASTCLDAYCLIKRTRRQTGRQT